MRIFPRIDSPCPYKSRLAEVMDGDFCRMCSRNVINLDGMSNEDRTAFLAACEDQVCVSYSMSVRPALAAAALAAAAVALPTAAAAQEAPVVADTTVPDATAQDNAASVQQVELIFVGGIRNPKDATFVTDASDVNIPELPVRYEDDPVSSPSGS